MIQSAAAERRLVLSDLIPGDRVRDALLVVGLAGLVGLAAQLSIRLPFTPVPITGQTFAVLLGGMAVGTRRAGLGLGLYLAAGLLGIPWFAGAAGGWTMLSNPSFGYIIGFLAAAILLGELARRGMDRRPAGVLLAMAAGNLVIYAAGATWLAFSLHLDPERALALGVTPFLLGDLLKALLAASLLPTAWRLIGRRGRQAPQ